MSDIKLTDLSKDELKKFIKFVEKVLCVCPEEDVSVITAELEQAKSLLNEMENKMDKEEVKTIEPNDVKKGAIVTMHDGRTCEVIDNRKGIRRMIKIEVWGMPGMFDYGDEYVYRWNTVVQNGETYKVQLPEKLQKQADQIRMFMGDY